MAASADAPKWSIPMISPASPTMSRQPWGTPASTETRALTAAGRTFSRYPGGLLVEPFTARHRHDAGRDARLLERLASLDGELHLGAGGHEDHVRGRLAGVVEDVGALGDAADLAGAVGAGAVDDRAGSDG